MKDFAIKIREMLPEIDSGWDEDIERVLIEVAAQTRREALNEAIEYCAKYREAYAEDLFPTRALNVSDLDMSNISGRMGRFLLDSCIKDFKALAAQGKDGVE